MAMLGGPSGTLPRNSGSLDGKQKRPIDDDAVQDGAAMDAEGVADERDGDPDPEAHDQEADDEAAADASDKEGAEEDREEKEDEEEQLANEFLLENLLTKLMDEIAADVEDVVGEKGTEGPPPLPPPVGDPPPPSHPQAAAPAPAAATKPIHVPFGIKPGRLSFYPKDKRFEARCPNPAHGRCILTRFAKEGPSRSGRPLGLMAHWVLNHSQKLQPEHIYAPDPSLSLRQEAMEIMKGSPGMLPLLQAERKQNVDAGEPEEPLAADH